MHGPVPRCRPLEPSPAASHALDPPSPNCACRAPRVPSTSASDPSARDGQPVYSVEEGTVSPRRSVTVRRLHRRRALVRLLARSSVAVRHHQAVRGASAVGHVRGAVGPTSTKPSAAASSTNPLRMGALTPLARSVLAAHRRDIRLARRQGLSPFEVHRLGGRDLSEPSLGDLPPPPRAAWANMPVTPALARWRVLKAGQVIRPWHSPVDFRRTLLPPSLFPIVRSGRRQSHPNKPGRYRFYVARAWATTPAAERPLPAGVSAADVQGNHAKARLPAHGSRTRRLADDAAARSLRWNALHRPAR